MMSGIHTPLLTFDAQPHLLGLLCTHRMEQLTQQHLHQQGMLLSKRQQQLLRQLKQQVSQQHLKHPRGTMLVDLAMAKRRWVYAAMSAHG